MSGHVNSYLGYFLGPQAESADLLDRLMSAVIDDHVHWRRNYFPEDRPTVSPADLPALAEEHAELEEQLRSLLSRLRRSFPFHSPRYLAHQQSDPSLPSLLGSLAGLLYNSNNVTSESGNATMELELEAASRLLVMLGYRPPPEPPVDATPADIATYRQAIDGDYGWCHLTSGGTSANIEALWVARNVSYRALSVADACRSHSIEMAVTDAAGVEHDIRKLGDRELLNLPTRSAIHLLTDLYERAGGRAEAGRWLKESERDIDQYLPRVLSEHPPVILVAGTAHYSISKAVDLIGLGSAAVETIPTDGRHRIDIARLRERLDAHRSADPPVNVLAVIAVIGTTEEGSIDPLHEILDLRGELATQHGQSFWVHADGAWGGYLRCLLQPSPPERFNIRARLMAENEDVAVPGTAGVGRQWLSSYLTKCVGDAGAVLERHRQTIEEIVRSVADGRWERADTFLAQLAEAGGDEGIAAPRLEEDAADRWKRHRDAQLREALVSHFEVEVSAYGGDLPARRAIDTAPLDEDVLAALDALSEADSVTVDPHKLGYQHYACGAIAFRDSRARHHIAKRAPYLSGVSEDGFQHRPLMYLDAIDRVEGEDRTPPVKIETASPYTLEGSRPSYPATALWLSTQVLPLDQSHMGEVLGSSFLAARSLYELIVHWDEIERQLFTAAGGQPTFRIAPLAVDPSGQPVPPDTNLVVFGVVPTGSPTLAQYNALTQAVYEPFRISVEQGERAFSYSHPFFLSKSEFAEPAYPLDSIRPVAVSLGIVDFEEAYPTSEMFVLRSAVMSPYLLPSRDRGRGDVLLDFVRQLADVARTLSRSPGSPAVGNEAQP